MQTYRLLWCSTLVRSVRYIEQQRSVLIVVSSNWTKLLYYYKTNLNDGGGRLPNVASDVTVLWLNTGITVITVYRGKPTPEPMWLYCSMTVSYAMPSESSKVKHTQLRFPALPYMYGDFLWIPWICSQYNVCYLVKDFNSLQFCIAKCDF